MRAVFMLTTLILLFSAPSSVFPAEREAAVPGGYASDEDMTREDEFPLDDFGPVIEGEGVSFSASRERNPQVKTIEREEIEKTGAVDLASLLEKTLNVNVTRNGTYGSQQSVGLRGFGGGRVAVLIDGLPVNSPQSGGFDLGRINLDAVEKIEVSYGGSDAGNTFDGAVGGVVNIITAKGKTGGFGAGAEFSNLSYFSGPDTSRLTDTQNAKIDFSLSRGDVFWKFNAGGTRAENGYRAHNEVLDSFLSSSLAVGLSSLMRLRLTGDAYIGRKNSAGPLGTNAEGTENDRSFRGAAFFEADYLCEGALDTDLSSSWSFDSLGWKDESILSLHKNETFTAINRWNWYAEKWLVLSAGGTIEISRISSSDIGKKTQERASVTVSAEMSAGKKMDVLPSVTAVFARASLLPVPKLGFVFRLDNGWVIKNNYFRVFKFPAMNALYWPSDPYAQGNPKLKNENGFGADIVLDKTFAGALSFESALFMTSYRNAIIWQSHEGKWRPENIGEAFSFGSDMSFKSAFAKAFGLTLNYGFLLTYVLTDDLSFADDKRLPYAPVHTLGAGAEFAFGSHYFSVSSHFESERFTSTLNINTLPPVFTMDLNYNLKAGPQLTLYAAAKNALNEQYVSVDGYPMPGISITAGLRYRFR